MKSVQRRVYYGWIIVAIFFAISTIMFGNLTSFGVFFKSIGNEFGMNRAATSAIFSVQNIFGAAMSFIGGWAVDKFGPRVTALFVGVFTGFSLILTGQTNAYWQLFLTYSLMFSVIGAVYTMMMSTVSRWFQANRGLAMGIAGAGIGLGTVLIAPFATYLITKYEWRLAYVIMGILALLIIVPSSLLIKRPVNAGKNQLNTRYKNFNERNALPQNSRLDVDGEGISIRTAVGISSFWLVGSIWFLHAFNYFLVIVHLVPHATDLGITAMEAATILSLIGISYIIGRLLMGRASDLFGAKRIAFICAILMVLSMVYLLWSQTLTMMFIFGIVFGLANGGLDTSMAALVANTFGTRHIGSIMGMLQVNWGLGVVIGPAIGGWVFDVNNAYFSAFLIGALAVCLLAVLLILIKPEAK